MLDTPSKDDRFFLQVPNPTPELLTKYAQLILDDATQRKPIQFTGTMPFWTPPNGVMLNEQFGVEPKQWMMLKPEWFD